MLSLGIFVFMRRWLLVILLFGWKVMVVVICRFLGVCFVLLSVWDSVIE